MKAPIPPKESERLAALYEYAILDTAAEQVFDDLAALAAHICQVPMATITFVDKDRQWFKSRLGIEATETPRDYAFCAHTILGPEPLIVQDATQDSRFAESPLVTDNPGVRFYAGFPLLTNDGLALGALCALDRTPHRLSPEQQTAMAALARQVMALIDLRRVSARLASALEAVRTLEGLLPVCAWCRRVRNDQGFWDSFENYLRSRTSTEFTHGICPECAEHVKASARNAGVSM